MEILILGFLAVVALIGWEPKEATQVALVGVWVAMAVCAAGAVIWALGRAIFY